MPVRSLLDLASLTCIKHIRQLDSIGDYLPYENVRHILLRVENAHQLRRIEINSPQIEGRTGEIWLKLIEKDFPLEFRNKAYKPQDPSKWYKVWEKYKREHDRSVEESELKFRNAMAGIQQDRERNTSKIVERKLLPRKGATGPRRGHRDTSSSVLNYASGSRTKTLTGAGVMRKIRREANEIANIKGSLSRSIAVPQRQVAKMEKAPQAMVDDRRRASQPSYTQTKAPVKVPSAVREHEERATFISDSEEGGDDDEPLFEEPKMRPSHRPSFRPAAKTAPKGSMGSAARSAAASLLKTRPSSTASPRPSSSARGSSAGTSTSPVKSSGSFPPKPRLSAGPATGATSPSKSPDNLSLKASSKLPEREGLKAAPVSSSRSQASPSLEPSAEPDAQSPAGSPPPRPLKRKAPAIFMRPRKRVN
ncbi:hypothetical protein ACO1O0_000480 [Amphichorda felina]